MKDRPFHRNCLTLAFLLPQPVPRHTGRIEQIKTPQITTPLRLAAGQIGFSGVSAKRSINCSTAWKNETGALSLWP